MARTTVFRPSPRTSTATSPWCRAMPAGRTRWPDYALVSCERSCPARGRLVEAGVAATRRDVGRPDALRAGPGAGPFPGRQPDHHRGAALGPEERLVSRPSRAPAVPPERRRSRARASSTCSPTAARSARRRRSRGRAASGTSTAPGRRSISARSITVSIPKKHRFTEADVFEWLPALASEERFDLAIADPPAMTSRTAQVPKVLRAYDALYRKSRDPREPRRLGRRLLLHVAGGCRPVPRDRAPSAR